MYKYTPLYEDGSFIGYHPVAEVEAVFRKRHTEAKAMAANIIWPYVLIYGILYYDPETQGTTSAELLSLELSYGDYISFVARLSKNCRVFIVKGYKGCED